LLGKRVFDVESVLGLADEELSIDENNLALEERIDAAAIDSAVRATMFRLIPNDSPVTYQRISSSYGSRINPISGRRHVHTGIDLTCKRGEEILAPADGVVETVRPGNKGYGNYLTLRHSFGFSSSFAHLNKFNVKSGQFVSKGDVIAQCGNSGNSTGPHLHYEVRFLGRTLNPQSLMEWTPENFNYVFEKEKMVKWGPLVQLIDNVVRLQINLTNSPYRDTTINTVSSEDNNETIIN
ncbi:M23 family metallopeptidase, partial [Vibrio parahaemolyticus]|nr:M23 family metallopeptidase [Vibrio parahaemolyticus]